MRYKFGFSVKNMENIGWRAWSWRSFPVCYKYIWINGFYWECWI